MRKPNRFFDSLAWRLTASFAVLSLGTMAIFMSLVYLSLVRSISQETDGYLEDTISTIQNIVKKEGGIDTRTRDEIAVELSKRVYLRTFARVLDQSGGVVVETRGLTKILPKEQFPAPVFFVSGLRGYDLISYPRGRVYRAMSVHLEPPAAATLQIVCDRKRETGIMKRFRGYLWASLAGTMILSGLSVNWIAKRGIRSVLEIAHSAERIGQTTLHERIESTNLPSEVRQLADSFNDMLDRLEESFARLSQFSEDIAHELRTPVNNLRGGMEVVLGKTRTPEEYRDALGSALEECERLARLVDRLLFIARSENSAAKIEREDVCILDEFKETQEFYEANAEESNVEIGIDADPELHIGANRDLLRSLLGNLVSNAIAHTPPGGRIKLTAEKLTDGVSIAVSDTGRGIPPEHLPHIFNRFYRVDRSRTKTSGGVGLGLAIVNTIAKLHGATLSVSSEIGKGTTIRVKFPLNA